MNITAVRYAPVIISVDADAPRVVPTADDIAGLGAACDRVLAMTSGSFPRQGVSEDEAKRIAALVKRLMETT